MTRAFEKEMPAGGQPTGKNGNGQFLAYTIPEYGENGKGLLDRISLFLKGLRVYVDLAYECGLSEEVDALILSEINFKLLGKTAENYKAVSIF